MNQKHLWILILLDLFIVSALGVDFHYEACKVPRTCFNYTQEIRFPFYIQQDFCGFPGFNLSCNNNGQPIITLSDNDYIIHQIFYNNQSLRVSNAAAFDSCVPPIQNLSLPANRPFQLISATNIFMLYDCNSLSIDGNLTEYKLDCPGTGNGSLSTLALFEENPNLGYALGRCRNGIVRKAPVDTNVMRSDGLMVEKLRTGFGLSWTASNCSDCERSGGKCGFDYQVYQFRCFCKDRPHARYCSTGQSRWKLKVAIGVGGAFGSIAIMCTIVFYIIQKIKSNNDDQELEAILKDCGPLPLKRYSFSYVKKITCSFKEKLGQGGYGCVYKGKQLDGRLVAVKVLNMTKGNGEEFVNEVLSISRTSHVNIVTLLGFCLEGSKRALIYEFMSNGSLEKFICNKSKASINQQQYLGLGWENLYQIAIKIAQGLEYLHQGCNTRILHFDIKPHNILLDEDFCPKISDFGLAKLCTKKESIVSLLELRGTVGYIAPELFSRNIGGVSHKSDVYSYGMMILEMVGARNNENIKGENNSEVYFPHWIYKRLEEDNDLGLNGCVMTGLENEVVRKMILVGLWCIQTNPSQRPNITEVLDMFRGSVENLQIPPRPFIDSPSRSLPLESFSSSVL